MLFKNAFIIDCTVGGHTDFLVKCYNGTPSLHVLGTFTTELSVFSSTSNWLTLGILP